MKKEGGLEGLEMKFRGTINVLLKIVKNHMDRKDH